MAQPQRALSAVALAFLLALLTSGSAIAQDAVYKWVDEDGNIHYSSTPPPDDVEGELVDTSKSRRTPSQRREAERRMQQSAAAATTTSVDAVEQADQQQAQAQEARIQQQRQAACRAARSNLLVMQNNARVYELDENGERVYISNEQRASRTSAYQRDVDQYCD